MEDALFSELNDESDYLAFPRCRWIGNHLSGISTSGLISPTMAAGDVAQRMTRWGDRGQYGQCCLHATPIQVDAIGLAEPSSVMREDGSFHASLVLEL